MNTKYTLVLFLALGCWVAYAQEQFLQTNFATTGGNVASNTTQRLAAVVGQPVAGANLPRSQTQAGFMQIVDHIVKDEIAPAIDYASGTQKINKQLPPTITATITDNISSGLTARIHYRKISEADWSQAPLIAGSGNSFSVTVQTAWFDAMGMEYYLEARDASSNLKRSPDNGSYYGYLTSTEETVPSERIGFGTETEDYKIITVPYTTSNNDVTSLFNELGTFSNTKWRMATYNNSNDSFLEYPAFTTLVPGVGYWMLVKTPPTEPLKIGPTEAPARNRAFLHAMTLKPGWNMIGNPYPVSISWNDVRTLNNNTNIGEIKVYNRGFDNGDLIAPYQGGFVFVNGGTDASIKIPFVGQVAEGGRKYKEFSNDIASDKWLLTFGVVQGSTTYKLGGFGMHKDGSIEADQFDDYNPPSFLNSPEINFPHPEHKLGSFCRDVLPVQQEAIWSFTAQGDLGKPMTFMWEPDLGNSQKELFLVDEMNLNVIDLRTVNQYTFILQPAHSFKVYFGENVREKILPNSISLLAPYPNPVSKSDKPAFKIALPDSRDSYSIDIGIINSTGATVCEFVTTLASGIHELDFELNGENITSGMHYYRVRVSSRQGSKVFTGKLVIL